MLKFENEKSGCRFENKTWIIHHMDYVVFRQARWTSQGNLQERTPLTHRNNIYYIFPSTGRTLNETRFIRAVQRLGKLLEATSSGMPLSLATTTALSGVALLRLFTPIEFKSHGLEMGTISSEKRRLLFSWIFLISRLPCSCSA